MGRGESVSRPPVTAPQTQATFHSSLVAGPVRAAALTPALLTRKGLRLSLLSPPLWPVNLSARFCSVSGCFALISTAAFTQLGLQAILPGSPTEILGLGSALRPLLSETHLLPNSEHLQRSQSSQGLGPGLQPHGGAASLWLRLCSTLFLIKLTLWGLCLTTPWASPALPGPSQSLDLSVFTATFALGFCTHPCI